MESVVITPKEKVQQAKMLELDKSIEKKKVVKKKINPEKEAFLYTSQKNASKLFAKYL